ncbi:MAG: FAD-dependent oxidoreductase, partial [Acidimicrobiales bacterium]
MTEADADVIVVGGGHNGLICAAYLARAGIDTLVLESRSSVGGCASTVSDLGARFNICNCDHTMIRAMPVIDELELGAYGLEYLEAEAGALNMFHDGSDPWVFFHEAELTLDALAATYPTQVE